MGGLSYPAAKLTKIQSDYSAAFGTDKPQGCFMDGEANELYYNRNSGPTHGTNFEYGDAIICKKPETAVGYLAMLGLSDADGRRNITKNFYILDYFYILIPLFTF